MASIRKQGTHWQAIIRRKGYPTLSKTFTKKALAQDWARKTEEDIVRSLHISTMASKITLDEILERYRREIMPRKRGARDESYRVNTLIKELGAYKMDKLTPAIVVDYIDTRLEEVSSSSIRREINILSVAIDSATALWGLDIIENPVKKARLILKHTKTLKPDNSRDRRPTQEEIDCLRQALPLEMFYLVEFAMESGMRRGEIVNMKSEHRLDDLLMIPETKTDKARTIPLTSRAQEILDAVGEFKYAPSSITHMFKRACKRCGIEDLHFHDMRHEAASRFFEMGLGIEEVSHITGQSWEVLRKYTHLKPENIAEKINVQRIRSHNENGSRDE